MQMLKKFDFFLIYRKFDTIDHTIPTSKLY